MKLFIWTIFLSFILSDFELIFCQNLLPEKQNLRSVEVNTLYDGENAPSVDMKEIKSSQPAQNEFDWFPLNVGNRWVYNVFELDESCFFIIRTFTRSFTIAKDTIINQKTYFKFEPPLFWNYDYVRIDTAGALLYVISYGEEELPIYDFNMKLGDSIIFPNYPYPIGYFLDVEDSSVTFNEMRQIRLLTGFGFLDSRSYVLVREIGIFVHTVCEFGGIRNYLKGCVINEIVYGDTTVTAVNDIEIHPRIFMLYQNYPNPFNPLTTIGYSIPEYSNVIIKIFDILGNEIETLVNENKPAGKYEQIWNADNYPSGVYFYKIQAGNFNDTGKMILMK